MIAESHIAMHTFPERGLVWADIFSCKDFDATPVLDEMKARFRLRSMDVQTLQREPGAARLSAKLRPLRHDASPHTGTKPTARTKPTPCDPFRVNRGASAADDRRAAWATRRSRRATSACHAHLGRRAPDEATIFFGLAGAMVPAGMRPLIVHMIENRMIDVLVSHRREPLPRRLRDARLRARPGDPDGDDVRLAHLRVVRFFDVLAPEHEFARGERFCTEFSLTLEDDHPYTTREYFPVLGKAMAPSPRRGHPHRRREARRADLLPGVRR